MFEEVELAKEDFGKNSEAPVEAEVIEEVVAVEEAPEVEVVEVIEEPKPAAKQSKPQKSAKPRPMATEGVVEVDLAALVYSPRRRNSGSVAALQDRLAVLGYASARSDLRGWFHDGTKSALESWQKNCGLEATGECSEGNAEALFAGENVELVK